MKPPTVRVAPAPLRARSIPSLWIGALVFALACLALTGNLFAQAPPSQPASSTTPMTGTPTTTITATTSPTVSETPSTSTTTPTATPIFSCCEEKIMLDGTSPNVRVKPLKNVLTDTSMTIQLDFEVDLKWFCKKRDEKKCRVYYEVRTGTQSWQERVGGEWKNIPWARVDETIITGAPLERNCNGKAHNGTWTFTLKLVIQSGQNVRHPDLRVLLRFPDDMKHKGNQYNILMTVDAKRADPRPDVKIVKIRTIAPP